MEIKSDAKVYNPVFTNHVAPRSESMFNNTVKVKKKMGLKLMTEQRAGADIAHWPVQIAVAKNEATKIVNNLPADLKEAMRVFAKKEDYIPKEMRFPIAKKLHLMKDDEYYALDNPQIANTVAEIDKQRYKKDKDKKIWKDLLDMKAKGIFERCF